MARLQAKREKFFRIKKQQVVIGDFWLVPKIPVTEKIQQIMDDPFPSTDKAIAVPTWEAQRFTKLYRTLK